MTTTAKAQKLGHGWTAFYFVFLIFLCGFICLELRTRILEHDEELYFYMLAGGKGAGFYNGSAERWLLILSVVGWCLMLASALAFLGVSTHQVELQITNDVPLWVNTILSFANTVNFFILIAFVVSFGACLHHVVIIQDMPGVESYIINYSRDEAIMTTRVKSALDRLQMRYECCGHSDWEDWNLLNPHWMRELKVKETEMEKTKTEPVKFRKRETGDETVKEQPEPPMTVSVPFSCCKKGLVLPCIHEDIERKRYNGIYTYPDQTTINTSGCTQKLKDALRLRLFLTLGFIVLVFVFLVMCMSMLQKLQKYLKCEDTLRSRPCPAHPVDCHLSNCKNPYQSCSLPATSVQKQQTVATSKSLTVSCPKKQQTVPTRSPTAYTSQKQQMKNRM